jgi:hypothetical protein
MDVWKACLLAIAVGMTASVFAQGPTPAQPAPAPATPATPALPAERSADEAEPKPEPAKSAAIEGELDQDKIMAAQKAGYEIRNENGEVLLCRKELKTGSRLRHSVSCLTAKQWDQLQSDTAQTLRAIERRRVGPNGN